MKRAVEAIRCVLIEDHEDEHEIFGLAIRNAGLPVVCHYYFYADEAFKALYYREAPLPRVIFLDLNMPRLNGIGFLQKLKNTPHLKHIPVFVYSLGGFAETRQQALELGAADFLIKPETTKQLAQMLINVLTPYLPQRGH